MTLDPLHTDPKWKKQVLEATRARLKTQCEFLQFEIDDGVSNGSDVSKVQAKLASCQDELSKVEADLKDLGV
jgi:outer membrane protein TolC